MLLFEKYLILFFYMYPNVNFIRFNLQHIRINCWPTNIYFSKDIEILLTSNDEIAE